MTTPQDFLAAGYKQYNTFRNADFLLQKAIGDELGIKYFLNIYVYNLDNREVFTAEARLTNKKFKSWKIILETFNTIEELENSFEEMWQNGGFSYHENKS